MEKIKVIILFFCTMSFFDVKGQCPKELVCHPMYGLGLKYDVIPSALETRNIYIDFGVSDSRTKIYEIGNVYHGDPALENIIFYNIPCSDVTQVKVRFNDTNNTFCEVFKASSNNNADCIKWAEGCKPAILTYLQQRGIGLFNSACPSWSGVCGINSNVTGPSIVSIGTTQKLPGYLLNVKGGILTEQYKVCKTMWCDYVFDDKYKLPSLYDIDNYINQYKHLPKTKTAAQIEAENGIDIGEIILSHQEKVEEAFLYLISLDEQLKKVEIKNINQK
jgi:hypothetical protein